MKLIAVVFALMLTVLPILPAKALDRDQLVTAVAIEAGISEIEARRAVATIVDLIIEFVADGELVVIDGFGTFRTTQGLSMKSPLFVPHSQFNNAVK